VTDFELATRVPLIVSLPNHPNPGSTSRALVEHLDIFPTALDVAGLPPFAQLMGKSLAPLIREPNRTNIPQFNASFSQIDRHGAVMGLTMRTDTWRITRWGAFDYVAGRPRFELPPTDLELFAHDRDTELDFDAFENENLANIPKYAELVRNLTELLERNWDNGHLPPPSPPPPPPAADTASTAGTVGAAGAVSDSDAVVGAAQNIFV
jgi:arylsulfatase A-like enzyme